MVGAEKSARRCCRCLTGLVLAVLLLLAGLPTGTVEAQDGGRNVPVEAYWQEVDQALQIIQALPGAEPEAVRAALDGLAADFEAIATVELADGRQIPLDSSYLISRLRDPEPDLERLEAALQAVLASRQRWPNPSHDSQDLDPLAEILARPEFQALEDDPGPLGRLWQRIVDFLLELLFRLFPESAGGLGSLIRLVLTVAGIGALVVALVFTLRGILRDVVADEQSMEQDNGDLALVSADQALAQAHSYSRSGDYRSAVRYLYISALMLLEERQLVRYDRTQTNQEYLRSVASRPELAHILHDVIDVFDRVWYGFQSVDDRAFEHYASRVEQLRQQR